MKIFLIASECPPVAGGIASYVGNTASMFAEAGHEVTVFARSHKAEVEQQGNLRFIKIATKDINRLARDGAPPLSEKHSSFPYNVMGFWGALSYQLADEVIRYIRSHGKPDVIESEEYSGLAYFLLQRKLLGCSELAGIPIVLTLHSSQYMLYPANKMASYQLSNYWVGRMEKFCTLAADGLVAPTRYIAKQATDALGPQLDIEIIPLPAPRNLLQGDELPKSRPTPKDIVYYGRLEVRKGIIPLVEACRQLWDEGLDFNLTAIGGDTWYYSQGCHVKEYLNQKYRQYINKGRLVLSPPIQSPKLFDRIAQAWCVVIPSLWENFPNTCLESMFLGKVVLASAGMGHVEMLQAEGQQTGFIFDWNLQGDFSNQLKQILSLSEAENLALGQKSQALIARISGHKNVLEKRISHFQRMIEAKKSGQRTLFPSVNYPPHGKIAYPSEIQTLPEEKGIVSVCIPFYNNGNYIRETLEAVYASSHPNLEVLILDDGSTDPSSLQTLAEVEKQYPGLRVIHSKNQGVAIARNQMAELARGEYLAFLDSDDKVSASFYLEAAKVLDQYTNVGFVASWIKEFGDSQKVWVAWNTEFPYLLCHNTLGVCTVVRKAAYLACGGMNPVLEENLEDYECWINLSKQGWLGVIIPEPHYFYRIRSDSRLRNSNRDQLLYLYDVIASLHSELYEKYATEIYNLLNQNGASWLWENPSLDSGYGSTDMTGMEIVTLLVNKLKRVYKDGGSSLIFNRIAKLTKSLLPSSGPK
ncbi:glycosyltransferase [Leptolyngbya sp. FACHB-261]|uniref:glycosyltransferase n=1 Tax=Leptolyngbya sp. FACHB-261 TaxID=2692806 RepID=UPI001689BD06|nr:glycosyltransferase [Leptolyngbya sp. FACHB-261]MBD2103181.1 glycosyltransferase [Leptolyngbya sp. FACHB-261]